MQVLWLGRQWKLSVIFQVILEDLPKDFAEALQEYNDQVTGVFSQYLTTVAAELENDQGEENKLPLSGIGKTWGGLFGVFGSPI